MVVYVSDHGDMGYEHGLTGRASSRAVSARAFADALPRPDRARLRRGLVELVDLFPTLCGAASASKPAGLASRSLWQSCVPGEHREGYGVQRATVERNRALFRHHAWRDGAGS